MLPSVKKKRSKKMKKMVRDRNINELRHLFIMCNCSVRITTLDEVDTV